MPLSSVGDNVIISALDQSHAALLDQYGAMTPEERSKLMGTMIGLQKIDFAAGENVDLADFDPWVVETIFKLAFVTFMETGHRWSQRKGR